MSRFLLGVQAKGLGARRLRRHGKKHLTVKAQLICCLPEPGPELGWFPVSNRFYLEWLSTQVAVGSATLRNDALTDALPRGKSHHEMVLILVSLDVSHDHGCSENCLEHAGTLAEHV